MTRLKILIFLLFILFYGKLCAQTDADYVAPSELEPGWGLYWTDPSTTDLRIPNSYISSIFVSPDGKWLVFRDLYYLKIMNLQTKEIRNITNKGYYSEWSPDSKILAFTKPMYEVRSLYLFYVDENKIDSITCLPSDLHCSFGGSWAIDNYAYFSSPLGHPYPDSIVFRMNMDSSIKVKHPVHELMNGIKLKYSPSPVFPTNSVEYFVSQNPDDVLSPYKGFDVTRNFDYNNRTIIRTSIPDTTWLFKACNTFGYQEESNLVQVGPRADVYFYLSFRAKKEYETRDEYGNRCNPVYWDSSTIAARNACGWYRVDTSGANLVQLVRSWTLPLGGISITRDGETIYYGYLLPDTTYGIMRMNRFGKQKELVIKMLMFPSSAENHWIVPDNNLSIKCRQTIVSDELVFSYNTGNYEKAELRIYDMYGNLTETKELSSSILYQAETSNIDVQNYKQGLYFIQLQSGSMTAYDKFVIIR